MKNLSVLCVALCVGLSTTVAIARGDGMGSHHSGAGGIPVTEGAFGKAPPPLGPTRWASRSGLRCQSGRTSAPRRPQAWHANSGSNGRTSSGHRSPLIAT
jgi:hypothetical protein